MIADKSADDTTISYSTDYWVAPQATSDGLQSDLDRLQKWSDNNKVILNKTKTKAMLATSKCIEKRMNNQQLQVKLNATELKQESSQKLLGVTIDLKLSFDDHINKLCNKLYQLIAMLRRIKQTMLYASTIWFCVLHLLFPEVNLTPTGKQTVFNYL